MNKTELAKYLDSTLLNNSAQLNDIKNLCQEAIQFGFKSVCINPYFVKYAKNELKNSDVLVCTVIGFPLGMNNLETKIFETKQAIIDGADEIDMVINVSELKNKNLEYCINEINMIKNVCQNKILKVIVETSQLNDEQKTIAANIVLSSNADFIKTSTGFIGEGAKVDDILKWKSILNNKKGIKASGGIRDYDTCLKFISSGATRIGTSKAKEIITYCD